MGAEGSAQPRRSDQSATSPLLDHVPFIDRARDFKRYWDTRKTLLTGVPLWTWSDEEITAAGYLKPLKAVLVESSLAALPGLVLATLWHWWWPDSAAKDPLERMTSRVASVANSLILPFSIFVTDSLFVRGALLGAYRTRLNCERGVRKLWYIDAGHGLAVEALFATAWTAVGLNYENPLLTVALTLIFLWALYRLAKEGRYFLKRLADYDDYVLDRPEYVYTEAFTSILPKTAALPSPERVQADLKSRINLYHLSILPAIALLTVGVTIVSVFVAQLLLKIHR